MQNAETSEFKGTNSRTRRLNVNLPEAAYEELRELADRNGRTMSDVVKLALGLVKVALEEREKHNRLAVTTSEGKLLKEIILP